MNDHAQQCAPGKSLPGIAIALLVGAGTPALLPRPPQGSKGAA